MTLIGPNGEVELTGICGYPGCDKPAVRAWTIYLWADEQPTGLRAYEPCAGHEEAYFPPGLAELERVEQAGFTFIDLAPA